MKYIIHACLKRMWYVQDYLVPSMEEQGIKNCDIDIRCDKYRRGNLEQCMQVFSIMSEDGGAWHMQDDVIVCRDFKERTEAYSPDVICGFAWDKDENISHVGRVPNKYMWWSFPCIYIPNYFAKECSQWFYREAMSDPKYAFWLVHKKYDDYFFKEFMKAKYPDRSVINLVPNLVDHVDFLIGGSVVNSGMNRGDQVRSKWFEDTDLVDELAEKINKGDKHSDE